MKRFTAGIAAQLKNEITKSTIAADKDMRSLLTGLREFEKDFMLSPPIVIY